MKRNPRQSKKARRSLRLSRIARADLGPDDVLVIRTDLILSDEDMGDMGRFSADVGCKVLVLPADAKLDIVHNTLPSLICVESPAQHKPPTVGWPVPPSPTC